MLINKYQYLVYWSIGVEYLFSLLTITETTHRVGQIFSRHRLSTGCVHMSNFLDQTIDLRWIRYYFQIGFFEKINTWRKNCNKKANKTIFASRNLFARWFFLFMSATRGRIVAFQCSFKAEFWCCFPFKCDLLIYSVEDASEFTIEQ